MPEAARNGRAKDRPWSIEDALPGRSSALDGSPAGSTNKFGRIPVQNGTLGFETESKFNTYQVPEERRIRSLETNSQLPSYLGLSLSVPTSNKSFPVPVPPFASSQ